MRSFSSQVRRSLMLVLVLGLTLSGPGLGTAHACPNCKEAIVNSPESGGGGEPAALSKGFSYSVLFMLAVPFTVLGSGVCWIVRAARRGEFPEL